MILVSQARIDIVACLDGVRTQPQYVAEAVEIFQPRRLPATAAGAGEDFRALEELRKLLYANELELPQQLESLRVPRFGNIAAVAAYPSASLQRFPEC